MIQLQVAAERTICEVRGVERQPAAQVLVNPPAGLEEVFALQTKKRREKVRFFRGGLQSLLEQEGGAQVPARSTYRPWWRQQGRI